MYVHVSPHLVVKELLILSYPIVAYKSLRRLGNITSVVFVTVCCSKSGIL